MWHHVFWLQEGPQSLQDSAAAAHSQVLQVDHGGILLCRGHVYQGKGHFSFVNLEPILCGKRHATRSAGSRELFALTLAHPDQSPGLRSVECRSAQAVSIPYNMDHEQLMAITSADADPSLRGR